VTNNEEAKIHIGDTVPYIVSTTNGTGDNAVRSEDVRFIDVGLKLDVTPIINEDGMVTMRLRPEISSVVAEVDSQGGGIPQVNKTEVETTVMVQDGMTIVLAGLRKEDKSHTKKGIPGLMDVPYLGSLFSRTSDTITSTEIVILITPHIVKGTDDYTKVRGSIKPAKKYDDNFKMKEPVAAN
jgi:general secretion pathway protein D